MNNDLANQFCRPELLLEHFYDKKGKKRVNRKFKCNLCEEVYSTRRQYDRHAYETHQCKKENCKGVYKDSQTHVCIPADKFKLPKTHKVESGFFREIENLYDNVILHYQRDFVKEVFSNISSTFDSTINDIELILKQAIAMHVNIRASVTLNVTMEKRDGSVKEVNLFTPFSRLFNTTYILPTIAGFSDYLTVSLGIFTGGESGMRLNSINFMQLRITKYKPIKGKGFISLPKSLDSKLFVNINGGDDELCFVRAVLFFFKRDQIRLPEMPDTPYESLTKNQKKRLKRIYQRSDTYIRFIIKNEVTKEINFEGCCDGMELEKISEFEARNPSISISVYTNDKKDIYIIRPAKERKSNHINLFLLKNAVLENGILPENPSEIKFNYHYCNILNLNSLLSSSVDHKKTKSLCQYCHGTFPDINKHEKLCSHHASKLPRFPKSKFFTFNDHSLFEEIPYKILFSFQFTPKFQLVPFQVVDELKYETSTNLGVVGYSLAIIGIKNKQKNKLVHLETYFGDNPIEIFLQKVFVYSEIIRNLVLSQKFKMKMTFQDKLKFADSKFCEICKENFEETGKLKVRDHDHVNSCYRMALCSTCNFRVKSQTRPICIGHGIMKKELNCIFSSLKPDMLKYSKIICKDNNEIVSLTLNGIRFIDSSLFLLAELDDLIQRQKKGHVIESFPLRFPHLATIYSNLGKVEWHLLTSKIALPKFLFLSKQALSYQHFPLQVYFIDPITNEVATEDEWFNAKQLFQRFKCKNVQEFLQLVSETRLLLLASVLTSFLNFCMKNLKLDPFGTLSLSSYSWKVIMSMVTEKYEYCKDIEIINFLSNSIRGPINEVITRQIVANNENLKCFNGIPSERRHLFSADFNALYPFIIWSSYLPFSDYAWLTPSELEELDIDSFDETGEYGYIVSCYLKYPPELMERDLDLPLVPYKKLINTENFSLVQKEIYNLMQDNKSSKEVFKTAMDFSDKSEYTVEIATLKFYKSRGIKVEKLISGIKYCQKPWLKEPFKNLFDLRDEASSNKDEIGVLILKNIMNRFYGFALSSTEKYTRSNFCTSKVDAEIYLNRHSFIDYKIINRNEDITLFMMRRSTVYYDKPLAVSFLTLDRSKVEVYKFWHLLKTHFPKAILAYIDTDSVYCSLEDEKDSYHSKLKQLGHVLDFSKLPETHPLYDTCHSGKCGYWKVESIDSALEMLFVRNKLYSILKFCDRCGSSGDINCFCSKSKAASGVPSILKDKLTHEQFRNYIFQDETVQLESNFLKTENNQLSIQSRKITPISSVPTTRILLSNRISTIPFGYNKDRI